MSNNVNCINVVFVLTSFQIFSGQIGLHNNFFLAIKIFAKILVRYTWRVNPGKHVLVYKTIFNLVLNHYGDCPAKKGSDFLNTIVYTYEMISVNLPNNI